MRRIAPDAQRYVLAVLAALVALFLRKMLAPFLGESNPYHTVWIAVVFSAWYCGMGPSVVSTLLSVVGVWYFFLPTLIDPAILAAEEDPKKFHALVVELNKLLEEKEHLPSEKSDPADATAEC